MRESEAQAPWQPIPQPVSSMPSPESAAPAMPPPEPAAPSMPAPPESAAPSMSETEPAAPSAPAASASVRSAQSPGPYGPFGGVISSLPSFESQQPEPETEPEPAMAEPDGETVFATGIAATHRVGSNPGASRGDLVLAALCNRQHPNPPDATACARCGAPVDTASPQLVKTPALAIIRASTGQSAELDGVVLVGRAPNAKSSDHEASLMTVPSPSQDISRTHLRFAAIDWDIVVTDLHSTNGTVMIRPGEQPVRMVPGDPIAVGIGTFLDLGDGVTIRIDQPQ